MRISLALVALVLIPQSLFATVYWTAEDAERAQQSWTPGEETVVPQTDGISGSDAIDSFADAAWFIASMQVSDPQDPDYGGIREGEHLPNIIQTDNTSESIWIFSRYYELTGDAAILSHIDASWAYVTSHPAYAEEGGSFPQWGYYRYYNCGWAVCAGLKYEEVFGDQQYLAYVDSCANYLAAQNLQLPGMDDFYDRVNPPVLAWGAGNLRKYGEAKDDSLWQDKGWRRGRRAKNWTEADPTILGTEEWAMSGGAVMWGVLNSYFRQYPAEEADWVATYAAQMDTVADAGNWENAWQGWYALGHKALDESTGDPIWADRHQNLTTYLLAFDDTDQDGGIMANPADLDTEDQAWVTAYLGFMGLQPLIVEATSVPHAIHGDVGLAHLLPNRPNPFRPRTTIPFRLETAAHAVLEIVDPAGRRVARLVDGERSAGTHVATWDGRDSAGRRVASGVYFYRLAARGAVESRRMVLLR